MNQRTKAESRDMGWRRCWLVGATAVSVGIGMAYTLWWPTIVRHNRTYWLTPGDIWSTVRIAHFVQWGDLSYVYLFHSTLLSLPGFNVLLAPVAALSSALGLSEQSPTGPAYQPHAWLLFGPVCLAVTGVGVFACDAVARKIGVRIGTRRLLTIAEVVAIWATVAMWGHPEDVMALGLALYSLLALSNGRLTLAGWLLGAAISMQLWVVLLVALFLGITGIRRGAPLLARAAVIPGCLLVAVLIPDFHDAYWTLTKQPGFPTVLHPTPWVLLATHISPIEVSSGPIHLLTLAAATGIGFLARRWRSDWATIFWLAAIAAGIRCLFEPVMAPYYVMPAVAIAFAVGATRGSIRWLLTLVAGFGLTVMTFSHSNMWTYWFEMSGLMAAMFVSSRPIADRTGRAWESTLDSSVLASESKPEADAGLVSPSGSSTRTH